MRLRDEFKYLYASVFKNRRIMCKKIEALGTKKVGMTREEIYYSDQNTPIGRSDNEARRA